MGPGHRAAVVLTEVDGRIGLAVERRGASAQRGRIPPARRVVRVPEEELIVIAPNEHPLALEARVTLHQLAEHDLLLEPPGTAFRDDLDAQAKEAGVVLSTKAEVDGMRLVASLAFEGFGAAVLPASAAPRDYRGDRSWKIVRVDGLTRRAVGLVHRRRGLPSAPARALTEVLKRTVATEADRQEGIHGS